MQAVTKFNVSTHGTGTAGVLARAWAARMTFLAAAWSDSGESMSRAALVSHAAANFVEADEFRLLDPAYTENATGKRIQEIRDLFRS